VVDYYHYLRRLATRLAGEFDYVIIDTRGGFDYTSAVPAVLSTFYVIILEADQISVQQVNGLKTKLDEYGKQLNAINQLKGFVVNKAFYSPLDQGFVSNVARIHGGQALGTIPADRLAIKAYQTKHVAVSSARESDFAYYSFSTIEKFIGERNTWKEAEQVAYDDLRKSIRRHWERRRLIERVENLQPFVLLSALVVSLGTYFAETRTNLLLNPLILYVVVASVLLIASTVPLFAVAARWRSGGLRQVRWMKVVVLEALGLVFASLTYVVFYDAPRLIRDNVLYQRLETLNERLLSLSASLQQSQSELFQTKNKLLFLQQDQAGKRLELTTRSVTFVREVPCASESSGEITAEIPLDPAYNEKAMVANSSVVDPVNLSAYESHVTSLSRGGTAVVAFRLNGNRNAAIRTCPPGRATISVIFYVLREVVAPK
jgi:hypothetical protein